MPIKKVKGGYKWGESGKVYPTKAQAAKQARAAYASGYKGYQTGDVITQSEDPFAPNFELPTGGTTTTVGGSRQTTSDPFAKNFAKRMLLTGILSNPQARQSLGMYKAFRDRGPMGLGKALAQREGRQALFRKVGPWGMLLGGRGGLLGLGSEGPLGLGIKQGLQNPRTGGLPGIINRVKFLQAFPQVVATRLLMDKIYQRIPGQKGILGGTFGPQARNIASLFLPFIKSYEEKYGMGSAEEDIDMYPDIQPVEVTAQMRETDSMREERERAERAARVHQFAEQSLMNRVAETGGDPMSYMYGLVPGVAQSTNQGLRAANLGKVLAKRAAARALTGREAKYDRSGLNRKISSGGASRK